MDRNSIIGIVIIAAIFIVWSIVSQPSAEERAAEQAKRERISDSIASAKRISDSLDIVKQIEQKEAELEALKQQQGEQPEKNEIENTTELPVVESVTENIDYRTIYLENDLLRVSLSEKGGRPSAVELKRYQRYDSLPLVLFDADSSRFGLNYYQNNRHVNTMDLYFKANTPEVYVSANADTNSVALRYSPEADKYIEFKYTLAPGRYKVDLQITFHNIDNITTQRTNIIDLDWMINSPQQEKGRDNEQIYTTLYFKPYEDDVDYFNARTKKGASENIQTRLEWIAYKDQFFSSVIMAEDAFLDASMRADLKPKGSKYIKQFESAIGLPYEQSPKHTIDLSFYFGPNKYKHLKAYYGDKRLQDLVTVGRGIIKWINQIVIINLFDFLERFIGNYGIIILIMTIIIKLALLPLTFRSYLSTAKMKVLKPQIDEINKKIPKEKAMERQQATMALYKKVGVSPLGGCLPMLLQMPILFAMFRFFPTSIELRQQSFLWATDLSTYDAIFEWNAQIPIISGTFGNHLSLFTLLMTVSTILSMKLSGQSNMSNQQMPGMQGMMYVMPVMFMFVLNKYSAGLTYYYFLTNLITIGQNMLFKNFIDEEELLRKLESKKAKPKTKSKWQKRLEELSRQQGGYKPKKK